MTAHAWFSPELDKTRPSTPLFNVSAKLVRVHFVSDTDALTDTIASVYPDVAYVGEVYVSEAICNPYNNRQYPVSAYLDEMQVLADSVEDSMLPRHSAETFYRCPLKWDWQQTEYLRTPHVHEDRSWAERGKQRHAEMEDAISKMRATPEFEWNEEQETKRPLPKHHFDARGRRKRRNHRKFYE